MQAQSTVMRITQALESKNVSSFIMDQHGNMQQVSPPPFYQETVRQYSPKFPPQTPPTPHHSQHVITSSCPFGRLNLFSRHIRAIWGAHEERPSEPLELGGEGAVTWLCKRLHVQVNRPCGNNNVNIDTNSPNSVYRVWIKFLQNYVLDCRLVSLMLTGEKKISLDP